MFGKNSLWKTTPDQLVLQIVFVFSFLCRFLLWFPIRICPITDCEDWRWPWHTSWISLVTFINWMSFILFWRSSICISIRFCSLKNYRKTFRYEFFTTEKGLLYAKNCWKNLTKQAIYIDSQKFQWKKYIISISHIKYQTNITYHSNWMIPFLKSLLSIILVILLSPSCCKIKEFDQSSF